ncbi:MAG: DUF302 domain-containing protein [SAR324 cluster bacterium]|nr:DUF302 domain-containing protein [SAR324 cluster bacterium]
MTIKNTKYGMERTVTLSYQEAIEKVTETLKAEGFGILTEIDVKATFKKKMDKDFIPYIILGACNPPLAFKALSEETDIGLLLPCNVVVRQGSHEGETVISAIDPMTLVAVTERDDLKGFAEEVQGKLNRALEAI